MASLIIVADSEMDPSGALRGDRRTFQLRERVTSCDVRDPHVTAQLIERIGWALADAEGAERAARAGRVDQAPSSP